MRLLGQDDGPRNLQLSQSYIELLQRFLSAIPAAAFVDGNVDILPAETLNQTNHCVGPVRANDLLTIPVDPGDEDPSDASRVDGARRVILGSG